MKDAERENKIALERHLTEKLQQKEMGCAVQVWISSDFEYAIEAVSGKPTVTRPLSDVEKEFIRTGSSSGYKGA